eukprot:gb/GECG01012304.1/.p1 GENE.gb/GECG01012304.1/~~gb/GECG01012304.1/.p1  ORF type:complete len:121 (+),score=6.97 gb/GECG01012304.1/:1-363(+)
MEGEIYITWFSYCFISVMNELYPDRKVFLVLDNASYHNPLPQGRKTPARSTWSDLQNIWASHFGESDYSAIEMVIHRRSVGASHNGATLPRFGSQPDVTMPNCKLSCVDDLLGMFRQLNR